MENSEETYKSMMVVKNLEGLSSENALSHIGHLTDLSFDLGKTEGLLHSIKLTDELQKRELNDEQLALSHYFLANAYADIRRLSKAGTEKSWEWQQEEIEKEIFHLRTALRIGSRRDAIMCPILTNLGNLMNEIGRSVEAIEYWDRALSITPSFGMARGNRGYGLSYYAGSLYDTGHYAVFLKHAHANLEEALLSPDFHEDARQGFTRVRDWIESVISPEQVDIDMETFSLGDSNDEINYRKWCLKNRLFLNPLNDLGPYPIAATDVLGLPSIVVDIGEGPYYPGYFNQMKQEFVSARYIYYEGVHSGIPHFSDREVLLFNTLDYPSYSLAVEKMKASFRMAYSLFDKIAFFLNHYLRLSIPERNVSLRTIWYKSQNRKGGLRDEFTQRQNWPLRGLFWLSKDLYEDKPGFKESIEPDAQELNEIRNHLEHKYLKLHDDMWMGPSERDHEMFRALADTLAHSMYRRDFQEKALRLIKMVRAALVYLSLAINWEEQRRKKERGPEAIVPGMPLGIWEDEWKV